MKQSKARTHGNCIEYNSYCTVHNEYMVAIYHYLSRLKSL